MQDTGEKKVCSDQDNVITVGFLCVCVCKAEYMRKGKIFNRNNCVIVGTSRQDFEQSPYFGPSAIGMDFFSRS